MKSIWICCFILHGCMFQQVTVKAFKSEVECQKYLETRKSNLRFLEDGRGQCASGEALLFEEASHE